MNNRSYEWTHTLYTNFYEATIMKKVFKLIDLDCANCTEKWRMRSRSFPELKMLFSVFLHRK